MDWVKARIQIQDILLYLTLSYFILLYKFLPCGDGELNDIFSQGANVTFQDLKAASVFQPCWFLLEDNWT